MSAQGGAAWAKNSADVTINGFDVGSVSRTRTGWTAGAGVEWMFAPNWSAFLEGNYMDFGSNNHNMVTPLVPICATGCSFSTKTTAATVLVGVNYRFNWEKRHTNTDSPSTRTEGPELSSGSFY